MLKLKLGAKGELIIPKKIREQLGFSRGETIILDVKDKSAEIKLATGDILQKWEERARRHNKNISKWVYGDKLYEGVF